MKHAPLLTLYRGLTHLATPLGPAVLNWRKKRGKEDARRMGERLGHAGIARPKGPLAWLHGASVGEALALLPLVDALRAKSFNVLITTGTVSSAHILAQRLPAGAIHQFVPLDFPKCVTRFLDHWRPDLAMIAESEIWPNLIMGVTDRSIPLVMVNARLSERSFRRWQTMPSFISSLLKRVDLCLAQTRDDAARLMMLGAPRVQVAGNLKYDAPAPPADSTKLAELTALIGPRPVWVAASTHAGEEEIILAVHRHLVRRFPDLLTIIVPRHANRGGEIAALAAANGIDTVLRSRGEYPVAERGVYIADTMGELGLFYRVASLIYVGKSLGAEGGQNPIEPAKLGSTILHGPNVANFAEVYDMLDSTGAAIMVADADTLARTLAHLMSDTAALRRMARAAAEAVENLGGAASNVMQALEPWIVHLRMERR
jgi:3-deoxy-D-manno-octulosonic-acid transferase